MAGLARSLGFLICLYLFACNQEKQKEYIAVINCNIIDGTGNPVKMDQTIIIKDRFIDTLGSAIKIPQKAKIIDASGKTIIPGMIDMHGHLFAV